MSEEFEVGEQHLDHARAVDEIGDVGLGDGAPDGLELPPNRQILETEAEPDGLHPCTSCKRLRREHSWCSEYRPVFRRFHKLHITNGPYYTR